MTDTDGTVDLKTPPVAVFICAIAVAVALSAVPHALRTRDLGLLALILLAVAVQVAGTRWLVAPRLRIDPEGLAYRDGWMARWRPRLPWQSMTRIEFAVPRVPMLFIELRDGSRLKVEVPLAGKRRIDAALALVERYAGPAFRWNGWRRPSPPAAPAPPPSSLEVRSPSGLGLACLAGALLCVVGLASALSEGRTGRALLLALGVALALVGARVATSPGLRLGPQGLEYRHLWNARWQPRIDWAAIASVEHVPGYGFRVPALRVELRAGPSVSVPLPSVAPARLAEAMALVERYVGKAYRKR